MLGLSNTIYIKIIISLSILGLLILQMNWSDIAPSFLNISVSIVSVSFMCLTLQTLVLGVRWYLIVNTGRQRMSYRKALQITFAALIANFVFLTSVSGLAVRVVLTIRENVSLLFSLGASLIDRLMTILALLLLAALFMPFAQAHMGQEISIMIASLVATFLVLLLGLLALSKTKYGSFLNSSRKTACTIKYMQSIFTKPRLFGAVISVSLVAQLFYFGAVYVLMQGLGIEISFIQLLTVLPMIALVSSLPIGIGGWGVREGAFVYGLGLLGVGLEQAFLVSIQIGLLGLLSAILVGLPAWLTHKHTPSFST